MCEREYMGMEAICTCIVVSVYECVGLRECTCVGMSVLCKFVWMSPCMSAYVWISESVCLEECVHVIVYMLVVCALVARHGQVLVPECTALLSMIPSFLPIISAAGDIQCLPGVPGLKQ